MSLRRYSPFVVAALGLSSFDAHSASAVDLLSQVPPPPANAAVALSWVNRDGSIVAPEYLRLRQAIDAERAAITALNGGPLPEAGGAPSLDAPESPEVQGALKTYTDYLAENSGKQQPAAVLGKRARWLHAAMAGKLKALLERMAPCPAPCTDPAALAQNQPLLPARQELADQDLVQWTTLFKDWQAKRAAVLGTNQAQIDAAGDGAKARTPAGRAVLAQYRAAMLREVEVALSVTELAVKRSVWIDNGDVDAVSKSTYSPKSGAGGKAKS